MFKLFKKKEKNKMSFSTSSFRPTTAHAINSSFVHNSPKSLRKSCSLLLDNNHLVVQHRYQSKKSKTRLTAALLDDNLVDTTTNSSASSATNSPFIDRHVDSPMKYKNSTECNSPLLEIKRNFDSTKKCNDKNKNSSYVKKDDNYVYGKRNYISKNLIKTTFSSSSSLKRDYTKPNESLNSDVNDSLLINENETERLNKHLEIKESFV